MCRCCRRSTNGAPCPSHSNACRRIRCPAESGGLARRDLGAHRDLPVDLDPETLVTSTETPPVIAPAPGNMTEPLENDPELATGNIVYYPPARIVDLRPNEFATTPHWLVGDPDRSS